MLVVLHVLALVGARLVVVARAVGGDLHPAALRHVELADEGGVVVRHLDAVEVAAAHGVVVHVPHLGADGHLHLHAVARHVGGAGVVDGGAAVEIAVHLHVALVAARGQQHALVGLDVDDAAVGLLHAHTVHAAGQGVLHQADDLVGVVGLGAAHLGRSGHAVPAAAVLEGNAAVLLTEVARGAHEVGTVEVGELHEQRAVAKRAAARVAHLVACGLKGALDPLDVAGELGGQPLEVLLGHGVGLVHGAHVGAEGLDVGRVGEDDALARRHGLAASVLLVGLVVDDDVDVRVDLYGLDIGGGAGHAVAHHNDVVLLVPRDVLRGLDQGARVLVLAGRLVGARHAGGARHAQGGCAHGAGLHEVPAGHALLAHGSPFRRARPLRQARPLVGAAPLVAARIGPVGASGVVGSFVCPRTAGRISRRVALDGRAHRPPILHPGGGLAGLDNRACRMSWSFDTKNARGAPEGPNRKTVHSATSPRRARFLQCMAGRRRATASHAQRAGRTRLGGPYGHAGTQPSHAARRG